MKLTRILYYMIIALLTIILLISGYQLVHYLVDSRQQMERYDDLAALVEDARNHATEAVKPEPTGTPEATADPHAPTEAAEPPILPEYLAIYELNDDVVGWLRIPDTRINYPVMQTPDEPNFYLHRNFDKVYNARGCLYAREQCDVNKPSDNITIFGHHMIDGSMLAGLDKYLQKSYWQSHPTVYFDTLTERHTYEVFAVFKTTATLNQGFSYHLFIDAADEAEFDEFVDTCKKLAFYDTGITPTYGDKIICLSTCEYTLENGRLILAAVRVD